MGRKKCRYNGNHISDSGKVITKCEDTQPRPAFEIGDNIWVRIHKSSWWPAQVVDKNTLGGSNGINVGDEGKVLARLYGSYEYLYVDPMKYRSEFENVLKQHNNSFRELLQKTLEQDLSQIKNGAKLKGKASRSEENAKPTASKDTNGKQACLKRKQEMATSFGKPLDFIGRRTRGKQRHLLEDKAGDQPQEGKMTMHEEVQVYGSSPTADVPTENTVGEADKNLHGGIKGTHKKEGVADKKSQEDKILMQNSAKKNQKPCNSESDVLVYERSPTSGVPAENIGDGANKKPECGRIKKTHKMECAGEQSQEDQTSKKDGDVQVKDKSRTADVPAENTVGKTNKKQKHGAIKKTHKADKQDCKSVDKASRNVKQDGAKKGKQAEMVDLKSLRQDGRKRKQVGDKLETVTVSGTSRNLRKNARKQEADIPDSGAVNEASESLSQDESNRKQAADKLGSVTVSGASRSSRKDGFKRKQAAEKTDAITVSRSSKSLRKNGHKGKQEAHEPDTIPVNGISKTPRQDGCDRKHETDKPETENNLKHSEDVNEKSKSTSSNLANSLLKGCQELSARRMKVMQSLGLVAPSGSPFSKVVLSKS